VLTGEWFAAKETDMAKAKRVSKFHRLLQQVCDDSYVVRNCNQIGMPAEDPDGSIAQNMMMFDLMCEAGALAIGEHWVAKKGLKEIFTYEAAQALIQRMTRNTYDLARLAPPGSMKMLTYRLWRFESAMKLANSKLSVVWDMTKVYQSGALRKP
jgi:hypothetical protein